MIPKAQHENLLMSSALLWLDNTILSKGQAFNNVAVNFYPIASPYLNTNCYASPFGQLIADSSISGVNIPGGVHINGTFSQTGQNGLYQIDYNHGRIYTTGISNATITGYFGIKFANIKLTSDPDEVILLETAYSLRPKTTIEATGLNVSTTNYPIILIKSNGGFNSPLSFGGMDITLSNIRILTLTDSQYSLDSINSIIRDKNNTLIPILNESSMPFNIFGDLRTGSFNYNELVQPFVEKGQTAFVKEVYISKYNQSYVNIRKINPQVYWSIIDLEIETYRYPRL